MSPDGATSGVRNSYVDALRALAIASVVVGHWLLTDVRYDDGTFDGVDAITYRSWAPWVTLAMQVVPIFFLVGGYANAISWGRNAEPGLIFASWPSWLRLRMRRLLAPTATYMAACVMAVAAAQLAGVNPHNIDVAAWALAFHVWFLAAYIVLIALTPLMYEAHRRWGFGVPIVMSVLAAGISAGAVAWHWHVVGWANYLFVWGTFHQLGFAWRDGKFARHRMLAPAFTGITLVALVALVWPGPYPVSMVGVPGADIQNTSPPSIALLAFGLVQCGLVLSAENAANRWMARHRAARILARQGAVLTMPVYLWHMVPVVAVSVVVLPTGLLPAPPPRSVAWLAQRVLWIVVLAAVLAALVAVLAMARQQWARQQWGRRKAAALDHARALDAGPHPAALVAGLVVIVVTLARLAIDGFAPNGRADLVTLAAFALGTAMVLAMPSRACSLIRPLRRRQARASARLS